MNTRVSALKNASRPPVQAIDARSLGRPVHLLKDFALRVEALLGELLRQQFNRRYRAAYTVAGVTIEPLGTALPAGAWLSASAEPGRIACLLDRALVLSVMGYRYGGTHGDVDVAPETSTEERLRSLLGQQLLQGLAVRLSGKETEAPSPLLPVSSQAPDAGSWLISVAITDARSALASTLHFSLDAPWMSQLLREMAPPRNKPAAPLPQGRELAAKLQLKLVARLLETDLPLGELLALKPGAVIPVRLQQTEVLVDGAKLFTASVAEHQGKLCLTSFQDTE